MNYNDIFNRMSVLGDALQLKLPAKAMAETLLLRAHYSKGLKEWQTMTEQVQKDLPREKDEAEEAYGKRLNEILLPKAADESELPERRYTTEAFELLCGAASECDEIASGLTRSNNGEPGKLPIVAWLDFVAANLVKD